MTIKRQNNQKRTKEEILELRSTKTEMKISLKGFEQAEGLGNMKV